MRPAPLQASVLLSLAFLLFASNGQSDDFDKLTYFTFPIRVQIPGATLPPGTYQFKLANPNSGRDVGMVASRNGTTVYSQFLMTRTLRRTHGDFESLVVFREAPAGTAPAVYGWFYSMEDVGYELVYSNQQATAFAPLLPANSR